MVSRGKQKRSRPAFVSSCLCVFVFTGFAACSGGAAPARQAPTLSARQAERSLAQKGINLAPGGQFHPDQPVTQGELALILVRMIDYLENQGAQKVSQSKSPPLVAPRVRAALQSLPHRHPAYSAVARLARGGYLLPSNHGDLFLPTRQNIDRPVTARELSAALAGIACRIAEKRAVREHPEVLDEQRETVTSPGQHRGLKTPAQ
jgi:hypothetical protein